MNKKFSTLVAGVLLATSFGASAQTVTTTELESGKYYLLKTQTANSYLTLSGDSLAEFTGTTLTKAQREAAYWKVDYVKNADGNYTYSFTNKTTGQPLAISEGKAGFGGAISSFAWIAPSPAYTTTAIAHKGTKVPTGFDAVAIYKVMKLVKDVTINGSAVPTIAATDVAVRYEVVAIKTAAAAATDFNGFKAIEDLTADDMKSSTLKVFLEDATKFPAVAGTLKAGTVLYAKAAYATNVAVAAAMTFQPADVDAINLMTGTNFATEIAPATSSSFKFGATTTHANVLADNKFEVVTRKMLVNATTGVGEVDATAKASYDDVQLLKVKDKEEYLAVDTAVWVTEKGSTYHKIITAGLKDLTSSVADAVADVKYYNAADKRMAAAYLFSASYDSQADSLIIAPVANLTLGNLQTYWADDTTGVASANAANGKTTVTVQPANTDPGYQQVSTKLFSSVTELTLVSPKGIPAEVPAKISLGVSTSSLEVYDLASGVYLMNLVSTGGNQPADNGKYKVQSLLTNDVKWLRSEVQDFKHMPATQWVVEKAKDAKTVSIWNRETGAALVANTIFYKNGTDAYTVGGDTLTFTKLTDNAVVADSTLGYFAQVKDAEKAYKLNYFSGLDNSKFVLVTESGDHQIMSVDPKDGYSMFALEATAAPAKYGVEKKDIAKILYRQAYRLYVVPTNKFIAKGDTMYVVYNSAANEYRIQKDKKENASFFYLKEFNDVEGLHYYAMIDKKNDGKKVGVKDVILNLQPELLSEVRTSSFALVEEDAPLYRRLGVTNAKDGFTDLKTDTAQIYLTRNDQRFLYENTKNNIAGDFTGINYLGEYNSKQFTNAAALFIDTAYVRGATNRPQYMIALRPQFGKFVDCPVDPSHPAHLIDQVKADYLVNLSDSIYGQKNQDKLFKFEEKTRLAFVPAIHHGDTLTIQNSKFTGNSKKIAADKADTFAGKDSIYLGDNAWNNVTFQFRLIDNGAAADFFIESNNNDGVYSYVQILNGVPVLTSNIADAERFNIGAPAKDVPTDNEGIETTVVSVIAGNGQVVINNAQGKTVAISNILGQTLANTVLTSDNATIAVPAGIVVVAVEGEAAVKAIVK